MKQNAYISIIEPDAEKAAQITRFLKGGSDHYLFSIHHFETLKQFEKNSEAQKMDAIVSSDPKIAQAEIVSRFAVPVVVLGEEKPASIDKFSHADFLIYNKLNLYHLPKVLDNLLFTSLSSSSSSQPVVNTTDFAVLESLPMAILVFNQNKLVFSNTLSRPLLNADVFPKIVETLTHSESIKQITYKGTQFKTKKKSIGALTYVFVEEEQDYSAQLLSAITKLSDEITLLVFKEDKLIFKNEKAENLLVDVDIFSTFDQLFAIEISQQNIPQLKHKSSGISYAFNIEELESPNGKFQLLTIKSSHADQLPVNVQDAILNALSHDLKEPLRTSMNYSQILTSRIEDEEMKQFSSIVSKELKKMDQLLQNIKQVFNPASIKLKKEIFPLQTALEAALKELKPMIDEADAIIDLSKLPEVKGDKAKLTQVFRHLIENAIKFRKPDKRCFIEILNLERDNEILVCVKDNGVGIDESYHEKIFTPFARLQSYQTQSGSGLGLHLAKSIVESHGGRIWVESYEGFGSSFYFTIPS